MHQRLTIAAVYGHRDGTAVIPALLTSVLQLPGSRALLLSPWRPPDLPSAITWRLASLGHGVENSEGKDMLIQVHKDSRFDGSKTDQWS